MQLGEKIRRLRWKARRGMLELDIAFTYFIENDFSHLTPSQQDAFELLLEQEDNDLFGWVLGHQEVTNLACVEIVQLIQDSLAKKN